MGADTDAPLADRHARGVAAYARIFGVPEDRVVAAFAARVGPVFAEEQLQAAGGAAWADPAFSGRDTHLDLARQNGLEDDALTALMVLLAGYLGYAHASLAMEIIHARAAATPGPQAADGSQKTTR